MAEDNMNDLINNVKNMVDSGNIPNEVQELLKNLSNSSNNATSNSNVSNNDSEISNNNTNTTDFSNSLNNLSQHMSNNNSNSSKDSSNNSNGNDSENRGTNNDFASSIDIGTILKMKSIIDTMNQKDDPRANLLYSLKPYLRDSRKNKLDQYVNLLNMTKIADVLKKEGKL